MNELSEKLKQGLINHLRNKTEGNKAYAYMNGKIYTSNEFADEIENESEIGLKVMTSILELGIEKLYKNG